MTVEGESVVYEGSSASSSEQKLRIIHYNDVYHVEQGSREPVGGVPRFQHLVNYYRNDDRFKDQPKLLTLFSGDAFNPSLESSCTKGSHMVPILNNIGTDVACVGNHDLDFGVPQFEHLAKQCTFPWLLANVLDLDLGEDVPLGHAKRTIMLTSSNGVKIGVLGLVEREWLATVNSLPPNLKYESAAATAKELIPQLREQGAEMIVVLTHARQPNDEKLAKNVPEGYIDIILGGHDHDYNHSVINGIHLLRSGTDFKQLSYIDAWQTEGGKWDFKITRRDVVSSLPEDKDAHELVQKLTANLKSKMDKPIAYTAAPLDGRFTTVRKAESNLGNFVCDLMRLYYQADCSIMAAGTIRGDQVYLPGVLRLKDIMTCFPFEDPVVVLKLSGKAIWEALENGVSTYPALEGRFPQVSNIKFQFDPNGPAHSRLKSVEIGSKPLEPEKHYVLATRGYMAKGKDGYESLQAESEGGSAIEVVSEENGVLISMILRQYFMSIKVLGRWRRWGESIGNHWGNIHKSLHNVHPVRESAPPSPASVTKEPSFSQPTRQGQQQQHESHADGEPDSEDESDGETGTASTHKTSTAADSKRERELMLMRKVIRKWWRLAGLPGHPKTGHEEEGEFVVHWTKTIAPRLENRIVILGAEEAGGDK